MKEKILNSELQNIIRLELNKASFEEVEDKEIEKIEYIRLPKMLINGQSTGISISSIKFFKNLKSLKIVKYTVSDEDLKEILAVEGIEQIEFEECNFENTNFELFGNTKIKLIFFRCSSLPINFYRTGNVYIDSMCVDFENMDFELVNKMEIQNSKIKNAISLENFENIEKVNLDDCEIFDRDGKKLEDILVPKGCIYSHKMHDKRHVDYVRE